MNLTNGFCFAFTATLGNPSAIFSGGASLALRIQRSGLRLQTTFGDTTVSESFVFSVDPNVDARVVVSGDGTDYSVYVEGVLSNTFPTNTAVTEFIEIIMGVPRRANPSSGALKLGRFLIAEKDLRSEVATLDSWLKGDI